MFTLTNAAGNSVTVSYLTELVYWTRLGYTVTGATYAEAAAALGGAGANAYAPGSVNPGGLSEATVAAFLGHPSVKAAFGSPGPALAFSGVTAMLRRGQWSTCIGLIGDSTGDGTNQGVGSVDEWPQVLVKRLGANAPGYTVREPRFSDGTQGYDPEIIHQTGPGGERRAVFAKTTPGALQYAGTALTGDQDIRVKVAPVTWTPTGDQTLAARWDGGTGNRALLLVLKTTGALGFNWSTNGTAGIGEKVSTATIPATANPGNGNPLWLRVVLDVDNGATGNDVKFYYSSDGIAWTQLGSTVTTAGTTSVFAGTAPYQVGSFTSGFSNPFDGAVHRISVRTAIDSQTSVVPDILDDWDFQSAETTVSFAGAPVLTLLNGSVSGKNVTYFDDATRRAIIHQPRGQAALIVSTGHNDGLMARKQWLTAYGTMINNIKTLLPNVPILCLAQNQTGSGGAFSITTQGRELRATRGAMVAQFAAANGLHFFDAWPLVAATKTLDQLHPSTGAGSGSDDWGLGMYKAITQSS